MCLFTTATLEIEVEGSTAQKQFFLHTWQESCSVFSSLSLKSFSTQISPAPLEGFSTKNLLRLWNQRGKWKVFCVFLNNWLSLLPTVATLLGAQFSGLSETNWAQKWNISSSKILLMHSCILHLAKQSRKWKIIILHLNIEWQWAGYFVIPKVSKIQKGEKIWNPQRREILGRFWIIKAGL